MLLAIFTTDIPSSFGNIKSKISTSGCSAVSSSTVQCAIVRYANNFITIFLFQCELQVVAKLSLLSAIKTLMRLSIFNSLLNGYYC